MYSEFERIRWEVIMAYFKVLYQYSHGKMEEIHKTPVRIPRYPIMYELPLIQ